MNSIPPTMSEIKLYITAASVVSPVAITDQVMEPKTAIRRNLSESANGSVPCSNSPMPVRVSTSLSGMPDASITDQNITNPRISANPATSQKMADTLKTVHESIFLTMRRTRRTWVVKGSSNWLELGLDTGAICEGGGQCTGTCGVQRANRPEGSLLPRAVPAYGRAMSKTSPSFDRSTPAGERAADRLARDKVIWLATVNAHGIPQTSPVWFLWDESSFLVYSRRSARVTNIQAHPQVSLNLDGNGKGGDIVVVVGTARIDESLPSVADSPTYLAKYGAAMSANSWSPEWFTSNYPVPIVITPTKLRYW